LPDTRSRRQGYHIPVTHDPAAADILVGGRCASMTHRGPVGGARQRPAASAAHLALAGNSALAEISGEALQGLLEKSAYLGRDVN
jgi:hypothetical protein